MTTIEQEVSAAILQKSIASIEIDGKVYDVAPPSIATLILVSEIVSTLPVVESVPKEQVLYSVLRHARDFRPLGEIAAVLILGAKGLQGTIDVVEEKTRLWGLLRTKKHVSRPVDLKAELADKILNGVRPSVLFKLIVARLNKMEVLDFFAITTSLSEANILRPTKEVVR